MQKSNFFTQTLAIFLIFCLLFTSCTTPAKEDGKQHAVVHDTDDTTVYSQYDTTQVYPEVTGNLVLDITFESNAMMSQALEIYQKMYPNVQVTTNEYLTVEEMDSYYAALPATLMAGKASDVVIYNYTTFQDIYKYLKADVFADLSPYFQEDDTFQLGTCLQSIMDGGIYQGKRLFVPLGYMTNLFLTTEEELERAAFTWEDGMSYQDFVEELCTYMEENRGKTNEWLMYFPYYNELMPYCQVELLDYESKTVNLNTEMFRILMEMSKESEAYLAQRTQSTPAYHDMNMILNGNLVLYNTSFIGASFFKYYLELLQYETPVMFATPAVGGVSGAIDYVSAAVPKNSPNTENAYAFIKILLSYEVQSNINNMQLLMNPVNNQGRNYLINLMIDSSCRMFLEDEGVDLSEHFTDEVRQAFMDLYETVTYVKNYASIQSDFIYEAMEPYFKGISDYDSCLAQLQNMLELYILE